MQLHGQKIADFIAQSKCKQKCNKNQPMDRFFTESLHLFALDPKMKLMSP